MAKITFPVGHKSQSDRSCPSSSASFRGHKLSLSSQTGDLSTEEEIDNFQRRISDLKRRYREGTERVTHYQENSSGKLKEMKAKNIAIAEKLKNLKEEMRVLRRELSGLKNQVEEL